MDDWLSRVEKGKDKEIHDCAFDLQVCSHDALQHWGHLRVSHKAVYLKSAFQFLSFTM